MQKVVFLTLHELKIKCQCEAIVAGIPAIATRLSIVHEANQFVLARFVCKYCTM